MKKLFMIFATTAVLVSCNNTKYEIDASFPAKYEGKTAVLANYDDSSAIDSAIVTNGKVTLVGEIAEPRLAQFMIDSKTRAYLLLEPGRIVLTDSTYLAQGTPLNDQFCEIMNKVDSVAAMDDMTRYVDYLRTQYDTFKNSPTALYFATEYARFSELPQIDSLLAEAPQQIKDSKRVERYRQSAILRSATMPGKMFTDFESVQPDGKTLRLSDFAGNGNYLLVDFWASWCPYCIKEFPELAKIYEQYADKGFKILGVAVRDKQEDTKASVDKYGLKWDIMYNAERIPYDIYGFTGIPYLMLIGPDGKIISRGESPKQISTRLQQAYSVE